MIRASAAKMLDSASPATITASQLQAWLTARKITSEEAVGCYLRQIEAHDGYLHAMISVASKDSLFSRARSLDAERSSGKIRGPLHGIPVLVKVRKRHKAPPAVPKYADLDRTTSQRNRAWAWIPLQGTWRWSDPDRGRMQQWSSGFGLLVPYIARSPNKISSWMLVPSLWARQTYLFVHEAPCALLGN